MSKFEILLDRIIYFRVFKRKLKSKYFPIWWCVLGLSVLLLLKEFLWWFFPLWDKVVDKLNYIIWG